MDIIDRRSQAAAQTHNLRGIQILTQNGSAHRSRGRITAIVLHQMGFSRRSAEDAFDSVIAHFCILLNGTVIQLRDYGDVLNDAYGGRGVELEFEGDFVPHGAMSPTGVQILAGRELVSSIIRELGSIRGIFAHIQFNPHGRPYCCGPHIWKNIGEWAGNNLGLNMSPPHARASIPDEWLDSQYQIVT